MKKEWTKEHEKKIKRVVFMFVYVTERARQEKMLSHLIISLSILPTHP